MLPFLAIAAVGLVAKVVMSDSSSSSSSSNQSSVESDYKKEKSDDILNDLKKYAKKQTKMIKQKYNTIIEIDISEVQNHLPNLILGSISQKYYNHPTLEIVKRDKSLDNEIAKIKRNTNNLIIS
jgi:hypothetical protein